MVLRIFISASKRLIYNHHLFNKAKINCADNQIFIENLNNLLIIPKFSEGNLKE